MNRALTRRQCLRLLCSALAPMYSCQSERLEPVAPDEVERLRRTLVSLCPGWLRARGVSELCPPSQGQVSHLDLMRIILRPTPIRVAANMSPAKLQHRVDGQIQLDFLRHETLSLGEWIVAKTEACLYELVTG